MDQNGYFTTGAENYNDGLRLIPPLTYQFRTNWMALPNLLAASDSRWLFYEADGWIGNIFVGNVVDAGIINEDSDWDTYCTLSMPGNVRNWFGLPYLQLTWFTSIIITDLPWQPTYCIQAPLSPLPEIIFGA